MDVDRTRSMDVGQLTDLITKAGAVPLLVLIVLALAREYRRLQSECRHWQRLALQALSDADKGASLAEFFKDIQ